MDTSDTTTSWSSYSECNCYLCQYGTGCQHVDLEPYPFYVRQPLVYFAQCRHGREMQKCKACHKPNCFVRAFRWYTNEHGSSSRDEPPCQVPPTCMNTRPICSGQPNLSTFASWLDSKYQEFMLENPDACRIELTETSIIENCQTGECSQQQCEYHDPRAKKRNPKVKRIWRRRAQKCKERESCARDCQDHEENQGYISMEFIMPPKNLSRAASECCRPTPCCSTDRHVVKSQSATATVCLNKSGCDNQAFDKPPVEQKYMKNNFKECSRNYKNVSCQCAPSARNNVQTQYELSCNRSCPITPRCPIPTTQPPNSKAASKSSRTKKISNMICQCEPVEPEASRQMQDAETCPDFKKPCPSLYEPNHPKPCPSRSEPCPGLRPCPSFRNPCPPCDKNNLRTTSTTVGKDAQVQYQQPGPDESTIPNIGTIQVNPTVKPCTDLQKPCPSLYEPTSNIPEPCPSLNKPCPGRKPCPSFHRPFPPCPNQDINGAGCRQAPETKTNSQTQYSQPYTVHREPVLQSRVTSQIPYSDVKPKPYECCDANTAREQGSHLREVSTGMETNVSLQGGCLECHCTNCHRSNTFYNNTGCCRQYVPLTSLPPHQNLIITTQPGEGKCSINCPYYSSKVAGIQSQIRTKSQGTETVRFARVNDGTAQTSSAAIRLDRGAVTQYPLFMKVVCADKLQ